MIVATSENGVIGNDGELPWYLPHDLKRFRKMTNGSYIIMGRRTYESIGRPLSNRINIVLTRDKSYKTEFSNCTVMYSIENALRMADVVDQKEVFIIGGESLFRIGICKYAHRIYMTLIHDQYEGDTFFPDITDDWRLESMKNDTDAGIIRTSFVKYVRKGFTKTEEDEPPKIYCFSGPALKRPEPKKEEQPKKETVELPIETVTIKPKLPPPKEKSKIHYGKSFSRIRTDAGIVWQTIVEKSEGYVATIVLNCLLALMLVIGSAFFIICIKALLR